MNQGTAPGTNFANFPPQTTNVAMKKNSFLNKFMSSRRNKIIALVMILAIIGLVIYLSSGRGKKAPAPAGPKPAGDDDEKDEKDEKDEEKK